jgi:hypothetical protein
VLSSLTRAAVTIVFHEPRPARLHKRRAAQHAAWRVRRITAVGVVVSLLLGVSFSVALLIGTVCGGLLNRSLMNAGSRAADPKMPRTTQSIRPMLSRLNRLSWGLNGAAAAEVEKAETPLSGTALSARMLLVVRSDGVDGGREAPAL